MYISLRESCAKGFRKWSNTHQLVSSTNSDDDDIAEAGDIAIAALRSEPAVMTPPERRDGPWLVPGVCNTL